MSPAVLDTVLAGLNVDRALRDAITGDLMEVGAEIAATQGQRRADRWMRQQILRSLPVFVQSALWDGGLRRLAAILGAAFAALMLIGLAIGASTTLMLALVSPETIAELTVIFFAADLTFGAAGGYLAARLGRAAPLGAAFVFGILGVIITLISGGASAWYRLTLLVLLIPSTVMGGWLHARHLARRAHST
jgi:hypothetical protein